jgi:uncharacterized SAM-binding protein YcdF (DUF218 family)
MTTSGDTQPLPSLHPHPNPLVTDRTESRNPAPTRARRRRAGRWLVATVLSVALAVAGGIVGVMALVYIQARTDETRPVDAIVVMGAAQYNGRPSPVFLARLEQSLALYNDGVAPVIVVTGGKQPGDAYTEAEVAQAWLSERGVPEGAIRMENAGRTTWGSVQGVPEVLSVEGGTRVLVVSDGFHLLRSELMLREVGYDAYSSPAPGSPIEAWTPVEFGYVVRETGGVIAFLPKILFG